jgi:hypothetical protein
MRYSWAFIIIVGLLGLLFWPWLLLFAAAAVIIVASAAIAGRRR